jgi:polar amino acid transport system substrate-binding protein
MRRHVPTRLWLVVVLGLGLALTLAACGAAPAPAASVAPAVLPLPSGVQDPAHPPPFAAADDSCHPLASLRPPASMPAPGAMPAGSTMAAIVQRGILRVGVDQNTYLFGYRDPATGTIDGFDIDMARQVARALFGSEKIQLVAITAAQRIPYVTSGQVDLVVDTMTINCARWKQVNFSTQYYDAKQDVLVGAQSKARTVTDLAGQKVCAAAGSTSIQKIAAYRPALVPVSVNDWTDCLVLLQQGAVAAISTDDTILAGLAAQDPSTRLLGADLGAEPYGMATAPTASDFTRFVNGVLEQLRASGAWTRIHQKWNLAGSATPPVAQYRD